MTPTELQQAKALAEAATPGPWQWFGNTKMTEVYLATVDRGRVFVMDFVRWGMSGAQPRFQVRLNGEPGSGIMRKLEQLEGDAAPKMLGSHRKEFVGIGHPDAAFIAASRTLVPALVAEVERLTRERDDMAARDGALVRYQGERITEANDRADRLAARLTEATADRDSLRALLVEACGLADRFDEGYNGGGNCWRQAARDRLSAILAAAGNVGE